MKSDITNFSLSYTKLNCSHVEFGASNFWLDNMIFAVPVLESLRISHSIPISEISQNK